MVLLRFFETLEFMIHRQRETMNHLNVYRRDRDRGHFAGNNLLHPTGSNSGAEEYVA